MVSGPRSLASAISSRWSLLVGSMASGTLNTMMLNILDRNCVFAPNASHNLFWLLVSDIHVAASSESISTMVPPLFTLVIDRTLPVARPNSDISLLISALSWSVSRWENFEFFSPSMRNCLALMPSLAAIRGLACAGGLISADAYDITFPVWHVGGVGMLVMRSSEILM